MPLLGTRGAGSGRGFGQTGGPNAKFIEASGGTVTTSGDYKIHTFTGPGTFTVNSAGNEAGSEAVDYLPRPDSQGSHGCLCGNGHQSIWNPAVRKRFDRLSRRLGARTSCANRSRAGPQGARLQWCN